MGLIFDVYRGYVDLKMLVINIKLSTVITWKNGPCTHVRTQGDMGYGSPWHFFMYNISAGHCPAIYPSHNEYIISPSNENSCLKQ